jgi:hypothetical protein
MIFVRALSRTSFDRIYVKGLGVVRRLCFTSYFFRFLVSCVSLFFFFRREYYCYIFNLGCTAPLF